MKDDVFYIKKEDITPSGWNPRTEADKEQFERLKESIEALGIRIPLVIRPKVKGKHPLIAGERRWKASKKGAMLPCIMQSGDDLDAKLTTLIENFVRENVSNEDHEKFIAQIYADGWKKRIYNPNNPTGWNSHKEMSRVTGLPEWLIKGCIEAHNSRKELTLTPEVSRNVTTADIRESATIKDTVVRRKLLEKRASDKQKTMKEDTILKGEGHIVHHTSRKLSQVPQKVALSYLDGKIPEEAVDLAIEAKKKGKKDKDIEASMERIASDKHLWDGSTMVMERERLIDERFEQKVAIGKTADQRGLSKYIQAVELVRRMSAGDIKTMKDEKLKSRALESMKFMVKTLSVILLQSGQSVPYVRIGTNGKVIDQGDEP